MGATYVCSLLLAEAEPISEMPFALDLGGTGPLLLEAAMLESLKRVLAAQSPENQRKCRLDKGQFRLRNATAAAEAANQSTRVCASAMREHMDTALKSKAKDGSEQKVVAGDCCRSSRL